MYRNAYKDFKSISFMDFPIPFKPGKLKSIAAIKRRLKKAGIPISKDGSGWNRIQSYLIANYASNTIPDLETYILITKHDLWAAKISEDAFPKRLEEALGAPSYSFGRSPPNSSLDYLAQYMYDFKEGRKKHRTIIEVVSC